MIRRFMIVAAALTLTVTGAKAQEVLIGVKGGLSIPNITPGGKKTPLSEDYSSRLAWGAGAFAEFKITRTFSLQVGLEYSGQGGKKDGMQAVPFTDEMSAGFSGGLTQGLMAPPIGLSAGDAGALAAGVVAMLPDDYIYANFESKAKFNYLMLPVQAKFGWNLGPTSPFRVYASGGLFVSYLMKAERISEGKSSFSADKRGTTLAAYVATNPAYPQVVPAPLQPAVAGILTAIGATETDFGMTQDITNDIYRFNFGVIAAVGVSYDITPRHKVFIEGGGNYGFVKIQKNDENGQNRIGSGSVMLGYSYKL